MTLILLPSFIIVLGVILLEMGDMGKVKRQVLLGVTLPMEAFEREEVKAIQKAYQLRLKWFRRVAILTVLLFIALFSQKISIQMIYFIVWTVAVCIAPMMLPLPYYKKLKALKLEQGWLVGKRWEMPKESKGLELGKQKNFSHKWFYGLLLFPLLSGGVYFIMPDEAYGKMAILFMSFQLLMVFIFIGSNRIVEKVKGKAYSDNDKINTTVNSLEKRNLSYILLGSGVSTGVILLVVELGVVQLLRWNTVTLTVCISCIVLLQVGGILAIYKVTQKKIEGLIGKDQGAMLVDEDAYWINGQIYCNPENPALFVSKRIGIGSGLNMGNPKAKLMAWIVGIFVSILLIYSIGTLVILDFSTPRISIQPEGEVQIDYPMYNESFRIQDIQEIELLQELPPSSKVNGASTDTYARGYFLVKGYGEVKGYWYVDSAPYIVIKLPDRTIVLGEAYSEETRALYEALVQARK